MADDDGLDNMGEGDVSSTPEKKVDLVVYYQVFLSGLL